VAVPLPRIGEIVSVHGSGPRDVWLLTSDQELVHHDGRRVLRTWASPCQPKDPSAMRGGFDTVIASKGEVHLYGWAPWVNESRTAEATIRGGRLSCSTDWTGAGRRTASAGSVIWRLFCSPQGEYCNVEATHGPPVPLPERHGANTVAPISGLWMRAPDDAWLSTSAERGDAPMLLHFNGVAWEPVALPGGGEVRDLWIDPEGHAWIVVAGSVLRWDGRAVTRVATLAGFDATLVRGTSAHDVWFFGLRTAWQFDGQRMHAGPVPFAAKDAWSTPGGEIWIVGSSGKGGVAARLPEVGRR
jgi:hypothetical protein